MIATRDLVEQVQALKSRISRLGPPVRVTTPSTETNSEKSAATKPIPPARVAATSEAPLPRKLGWRARRILETGLEITAQLRLWQERGERNDTGLDLVLDPGEFAETVSLADGSLRLLARFPESPAEQEDLCEGLEIVVIHLRCRLELWQKKHALHQTQEQWVQKLAELAAHTRSSSEFDLESWKEMATRIEGLARQTGLWDWLEPSWKDPLSDWARNAWVLAGRASNLGMELGFSERENRQFVLGALTSQLPHAFLPIYLFDKGVWDDQDRTWYRQWLEGFQASLPESLVPNTAGEHKQALSLLVPFVALQRNRPDRPGRGPLSALMELSGHRSGFSPKHWDALTQMVQREGTLVEAPGQGIGLIWDHAPWDSSKGSGDSHRILLLSDPVLAGHGTGTAHWTVWKGKVGHQFRELTGTKRSRWHIQLQTGGPPLP